MMSSAFTIGSAVFYLFAAGCLLKHLRSEVSSAQVDTKTDHHPRPLPWISCALILHVIVLYQNIFTPEGLNFGISNAASLTALMIATLTVLTSRPQLMGNLGILVWPPAALIVVLALWFPEKRLLASHLGYGVRVHAISSILAYSLLALAACQATLLYIVEHQLRNKRPGAMLQILAPLQTQETFLLQLVSLGLFLLSLSLISGMTFIEDFFSQHLAHKTIFSVLAWVGFTSVLWGRWRHGWRGRTLIRLCLIGFVLLALAYFGSKLVLEVILDRNWIGLDG